MAELVAAMLRPAARSLAAASANSSALAAYERTCAADTGLVRPGLGTADAGEAIEAEAVNDAPVAPDVGPHLAAAGEP